MKLEKTHIAKRDVYIAAVNHYNSNDISITDCAIKFSIDRHNLSKWIRKNGGKTNAHGKQEIISNIFSEINTEEKAYWLGFMYADGNVGTNCNSISLELAVKDEAHLLKFNTFLGKSKNIRKDHFRVRCCFKDTQIYNDLIKLGCVPKKSSILIFPDIKLVSEALVRHFIRGYIDGDGSIYISNNNINVTVLGTMSFLDSLVEKVNLPKRNLYKNNGQNLVDCYFFQYSGKNAIQLIEYLYHDCNIFLDRKYNKYLKYCRSKEKFLE